MIELISAVTSRPVDQVEATLRREFANPGSTVGSAIAAANITPHVWSDALEKFYSESDAFVFELAVWSRNLHKRRMQKWIVNHLSRLGPQSVLCFGDGLGFDSLELSRNGHHVTYFELPGFSERFARLLFEKSSASVEVCSDTASLPPGKFDVLVCLDVLEHVPDPAGFVGFLKTFLKPAGRLIVHSPFWLIHPAYATHLSINRRHAGSLELYKSNGLQLIDARPTWEPLVLSAASQKQGPAPLSGVRYLAVKVVGLVLSLARLSPVPFHPLHKIRVARNRWFESGPKSRGSIGAVENRRS